VKYKVGDLVRIKTWEELENEYRLDKDGDIVIYSTYITYYFIRKKEKLMKAEFPDRIVKIKKVEKDTYEMEDFEEDQWHWPDYVIKEKVIIEPIYSRFDILDIRED